MRSEPVGAPGKAAGNAGRGAPSVIGSGLHVTGDLASGGEIQVDGTLDGGIACGRLTVGEAGTVRGEIAADHVVVLGTVDGLIRARKVELQKTARITGDVLHESLRVEPGAFIDGTCRRTGSSGSAAPPTSAASARAAE